MELTVDGKSVHAATGGQPFEPARPAIVFLHGAGLDRTVWALQSRYFAHHGRSVLAVDLPGHGRSEGPPVETLGDLADWVLRLLDAAGLESAALVGHSLGATIALEAAGRAPERVRALGLIGTGLPAPINPELLAAAQANEHLGLDLINGWGHGRRAHVGGNRAPGLWMIGAAIRVLERAADDVLYTDLYSTHSYAGALEAAARLRCPVVLILGDSDLMTPVKSARELAAAMPESEIVVLENSGHMLMAERPDQVLEALKKVV